MNEAALSVYETFATPLYQVLETEMGSEQIYSLAVTLAVHHDLKSEWTRNLAETQQHVQIARELLLELGLDPDCDVPARLPVRRIGNELLATMRAARDTGPKAEVERIALKCVLAAEAKDPMSGQFAPL
jgi:hypothetical protein